MSGAVGGWPGGRLTLSVWPWEKQPGLLPASSQRGRACWRQWNREERLPGLQSTCRRDGELSKGTGCLEDGNQAGWGLRRRR